MRVDGSSGLPDLTQHSARVVVRHRFEPRHHALPCLRPRYRIDKHCQSFVDSALCNVPCGDFPKIAPLVDGRRGAIDCPMARSRTDIQFASSAAGMVRGHRSMWLVGEHDAGVRQAQTRERSRIGERSLQRYAASARVTDPMSTLET